jgi:asparagine synthase (glutamine-hydrolysing)
MCGIHFILDKNSLLSEDSIQKMCEATTHRGKDATHLVEMQINDYQIFMGHNLLQIQEFMPQPLKSECGNYVLIFNGEIYNFKELKANLKLPQNIESDTKILLEYLIQTLDNQSESKQDTLKLNGMYAFVLLDKKNNQILFGRDSFGIKPLYIYEDTNYLIFSSEIKAILASELVEKKINANIIPYYLQFKFAPKPATFYHNIEEVENKIWQIKFNKDLKKQNLLQVFDDNPVSYPHNIVDNSQDYLTNVDNLLKNSFLKHIQCQNSVGMFVSGGVDSTLLLALGQELGITNLLCFTISHQNQDISYATDDGFFAKKATQQYGYELVVLEMEEKHLQLLPDLLKNLDQPIADSSFLPNFLLATEARKTVRSVLTGLGADELFGGYNRHHAFYKYIEYQGVIESFLPLLRLIGYLLPDGFEHRFRQKFRLLKKLFKNLAYSPSKTWENFVSMEILDSQNYINNIETLEQALEWDRMHYLPSDALKITDKATMLANLEARTPYLDAELVNYVRTIPAEILLKNGKKWILKELLIQKKGEIYTKRPKQGFGFAFGAWIKKVQNQFLLERLNDKNSKIFEYIEHQKVQNILKNHLENKADFSSEIWALVVLSEWLENQ